MKEKMSKRAAVIEGLSGGPSEPPAVLPANHHHRRMDLHDPECDYMCDEVSCFHLAVHRQADEESRPLPFLGNEIDLAAMLFDNH